MMGTVSWRSGRIALGLFGALVACTTLVGCGDSEDRLATLRNEPMASYALPSAVDTLTTEFAGGTSGVSSPSMIRNTFTVSADGATEAIREIAEAAIETGWTLRERQPNGYTGDKEIAGISAQILIAGIEQDDTVWVEVSSRAR